MIGLKLDNILQELESAILDFNCTGKKPYYTDEGFRAITYIFMSVLMDKMFDLQQKDQMQFKDRENMAFSAGNELRKLIKTYTGIDTFDFFK